MYYFFSVLTGALIAVMIAVNGGLTAEYGVYHATIIIHIVGFILISALVLANRKPLLSNRKLPLFLYSGGAMGVATTVFNNAAFGVISVSAIMALGLLGQSITSILIDRFGLFGLPKRSFRKNKLIGLAMLILGVLFIILL